MEKKNPLGPIGATVQQNVRRLREERNLTMAELSRRLGGDKIGRKIPTLALARIEKGERRVDVDDLVALAIALGVSPTALLLPPLADEDQDLDEPVKLAERKTVTWESAWRWGTGDAPIDEHLSDLGERAVWLVNNRPHIGEERMRRALLGRGDDQDGPGS
jgi:transcriptional regulator with XRE-family HTH domain